MKVVKLPTRLPARLRHRGHEDLAERLAMAFDLDVEIDEEELDAVAQYVAELIPLRHDE